MLLLLLLLLLVVVVVELFAVASFLVAVAIDAAAPALADASA